MTLTTGIRICGKMSVGVVLIALMPRNRIRIATT
jgi:hypothetical protein